MQPQDKQQRGDPVCLLLHGGEHKTLGGPSVRVPRTAQALCELGVPARCTVFDPLAEIAEDIVHLFNVWPPQSALGALRQLKAAGKTVVFSPIYLDLTERAFWQFELPDLADQDRDSSAAHLSAVHRYMKGRGRLHEAIPGYHAMIREMLGLADHVIFLSTAERAALAAIGAEVDDSRASLVFNPVDMDVWAGGDPALFRQTYLEALPGPKDYVICIGRVEERKNQLMLARALRDLPVRLVVVGHPGNPEYAAKLRREAGPDALILGRLEPGGDMLRSALTGAAVFALPSWAEGAALAALEAAACGTMMVLGDRPSEREYFGDLAEYCAPGDLGSIREAVLEALQRGQDPAQAAALKALVDARHGWADYAAQTAQAYDRAHAAPRSDSLAVPVAVQPAPQSLVLDITPADPTGPNRSAQTDRINATLVRALRADSGPVRMLFWREARRCFIEVPSRFDTLERALLYCQKSKADVAQPPVALETDCTLLTIGGAWREQTDYLRDLETLKATTGCQVLALLHRLTPIRDPFRYPATQVTDMRNGLYRLAAVADGFVTTAQSCATDLTRALASGGQNQAEITVVRLDDLLSGPMPPETLSDPVPEAAPLSSPAQSLCADLSFVLAVGDLDPQSNIEMLHSVWASFAAADRVPDVHLVIVGALGPGGWALADRIARDPRVSPRLHILTDVSAADLSWLYAHCLFTVVPEHDPGGAHPVVESLLHGKLCLAAAAGDTADIAPDLVALLDPEDFRAWASEIERYASDPAARQMREQQIAQAVLPSLPYKTTERLQEVADSPRPRHTHRALHVGELVSAGTEARALSLQFGHGWHPAEAWGRWAAAPDVSFSAKVTDGQRSGVTHLIVLLSLRSNLAEAGSRFTVTCAGETLLTTQVRDSAFCETVFVSVPVAALSADGVFELGLHLALASEPEPDDAETVLNRLVGIGLRAVRVFDPELSNPLLGAPRPELWSAGEDAMQIDLHSPAHQQVVAPGLIYTSAWGAGSPSGSFDLWLPFLPGAEAQALTLSLRPIATRDAPVRGVFRLNGRVLAERLWDSAEPERLELSLSKADLATCGPAVLTVDTDSVMSPADLNLGVTADLAGVGVSDMSLAPQEDAQ